MVGKDMKREGKGKTNAVERQKGQVREERKESFQIP